ncbi:MAG: ATP-dependent DNA helicase [Rhodanobacteraceae bacterium]
MDDQAKPAQLLGAEGPFARELSNFAPRVVQQRMATAVGTAIEQSDTLVVEAGTGTGKTFAYLVPAILSGQRVIVSTGTKALQDQLFHRDVPRVQKVLGVPFKASLLKGRANYLCLYRLDQTRHEAPPAGSALATDLAQVEAWSQRTRSGDRMELVEVPEDSAIWPRVTSTVDNCLASECPFFDDCHVYKARRKAQDSDLVVVNHHLLLADMALKVEGFGDILPEAQAFVLDEAHQVPALAGQFFSQSVSARQISELVKDSYAECGEVSAALAELNEPLGQLEAQLKKARLAMQALVPRGTFADIEANAGALTAIEELAQRLQAVVEALSVQADRSRGMDSVYSRAQLLLSRLGRLLHKPGTGDDDDESLDGEVRWYETSRFGFVLSVTPLDLATPLRRMRESTGAAWIFTSATLSVAGRFDHFSRQMGLDDPQTLCLDSPFDFARQSLLYLPSGLPDPRDRDYTDRVIDMVRPVLDAAGGRSFVLFTSHRALRRAEELLRDSLPYPLLVQGSAPRNSLLEQFRAAGNAVLLGAATFWEGVDVAGEALSCVIIDKLPFAAPGDPVREARMNAIREAGGSPFTDMQVPEAAIALKQGCGRLIRDVNDRGVLMLCDPRLLGKGYGRLFLNSLPPMRQTRDLHDVQAFFAPE